MIFAPVPVTRAQEPHTTAASERAEANRALIDDVIDHSKFRAKPGTPVSGFPF